MLVLIKFVKYIGYKYSILHFFFPVKSAQSNNHTYFFPYCPSDILNWILAIKYALWLLFKQTIFKMVNFTDFSSNRHINIIHPAIFTCWKKHFTILILNKKFNGSHFAILIYYGTRNDSLSIEIRSSLI